MFDLWSLCADGKRITEKVTRWRVHSGLFNTARRAGHPAFDEATELSALKVMVETCRRLSGDVDHIAIQYHREFSEWLAREREKLGLGPEVARA